MARRLEIVGAPSSAGAYAPGQERAPHAWRDAGLITLLEDRGIAVADRGDVPGFRWRIDPEHMRAMNADAAANVARAVADEVAAGLADGSALLVLGGDCTVELGTLPVLPRDARRGLVYIDYDTDMNTPTASRTARSTGWASPTCSDSLTRSVLAGSPRTRCCGPSRSSCSRTAARLTSSRRTIDARDLGVPLTQVKADRRPRRARCRRLRRAVRTAARPRRRDVLDFLISRSPRRRVGTRPPIRAAHCRASGARRRADLRDAHDLRGQPDHDRTARRCADSAKPSPTPTGLAKV